MAEYTKKEATFELNAYNRPNMIANIQAWVYQIIVILRTKPGTIPDLPDYGIGIDSYLFMDADIFATEIRRRLQYQLDRYFPDIPVDSISVTYQGPSNAVLGLITIVFNTATMTETVTLELEQENNIVDFKIFF